MPDLSSGAVRVPIPGVHAVELGREWAPLCDGVEGRYSDLRGAGEWARVVFQLRETTERT